jgi:predicted lipid-binding transport protein (Tim44 family)
MGLGEELASFMMPLLLGIVAFIAIRFIMARMRGGSQAQPALAGAGAGAAPGAGSGLGGFGGQPQAAAASADAASTLTARESSAAFSPAGAAGSHGAQEVSVTGAPLRPIQIGEALAPVSPTPSSNLKLPDGFDLPAFERVAKMIFIRLQAANDKGDLDDLREFTTPEMFAAVRLDIQDRGGVAQQTDVERIEAQLVEFTHDETRQIASVRFTGLVKEERDAPAVPVDEIWHLVKPLDNSRSWAIAGIQQPQ